MTTAPRPRIIYTARNVTMSEANGSLMYPPPSENESELAEIIKIQIYRGDDDFRK